MSVGGAVPGSDPHERRTSPSNVCREARDSFLLTIMANGYKSPAAARTAMSWPWSRDDAAPLRPHRRQSPDIVIAAHFCGGLPVFCF